MRIYTEVNFQWDDKKGKLVEVSSDSFDYSGEMALASSWETWKTRWYDAAGNVYKMKVRVGGGNNPAKDRRISKSTDGGETWEDDWKKATANVKKSEAHTWFKNEIERFGSGKKAFGTKGSDDGGMAWQSWWGEQFGDGNDPFTDTAKNQQYLDEKENPSGNVAYTYTTEDEGLSEEDYGALGDEEKGMYIKDEESGTWLKKGEAYWSDEESKALETRLAEQLLEGYIDNWEEITGTEINDYQREVIAATQALESAEGDVTSAFEEYEKQIGRAGEEYEEDVEALTGEQVIDPVSGEVLSEGTFTAGMRKALKEKEEGLETTVTTREEGLEALREEAGGEIRAAEAKIGASGFASTGVGQTARDLLAKEIGGAARDIDEVFTEDRGDVTEGYEETKTTLTIGKEGLLGEYLTTREEAGEDLDDPWEEKTTDYQELLKTYGIGEDAVLDPYADITSRAEGALSTIQSNIQLLIEGTKEIEGMEGWDPFTEAGGYKDRAAELGFGTMGIYDPTIIEGLFAPTIEEFGYTPSIGLDLYDPDKLLPWEEGYGAKRDMLKDLAPKTYTPPTISDVNVKKDITRISKLKNGIPVYLFRYKWSNKMNIGVMAQDVEKIIPDAVVEINGIKAVNYSMLNKEE